MNVLSDPLKKILNLNSLNYSSGTQKKKKSTKIVIPQISSKYNKLFVWKKYTFLFEHESDEKK